ncbi:MAG: hypothetical protein H5U02_00385 [Clostridia bacterium]|nr:hypothetical protein [Clostridia bacterium]
MTRERTKRCPACGRVLPLSGFYRWKKKRGYGYSSLCRECKKAAAKKEILAPVRPYTPATDVLVVLFLDEDGMSPAEIARELRRDREDFRRYFEEFVSSGRIEKVREGLWLNSEVYAARMAKKRARAAL